MPQDASIQAVAFAVLTGTEHPGSRRDPLNPTYRARRHGIGARCPFGIILHPDSEHRLLWAESIVNEAEHGFGDLSPGDLLRAAIILRDQVELDYAGRQKSARRTDADQRARMLAAFAAGRSVREVALHEKVSDATARRVYRSRKKPPRKGMRTISAR